MQTSNKKVCNYRVDDIFKCRKAERRQREVEVERKSEDFSRKK